MFGAESALGKATPARQARGMARDLPLRGIQVVDAVEGALQSVGRLLADLGADVRRVVRKPPQNDLTFAVRNANKQVIDAGRMDLAGAHLFLTDWSDDDLAEAGLDLVRIAERTTVLAISDFGRRGPRAGWLGTPDVHFAASSVLSRSGLPEIAEPLLPPAFLAYEAAACQAVWVATLALTDGLRNGHGDLIDFSVNEALIQILDPGVGISGSARVGASLRDLPRGRPDARHLYPIFRTSDGRARICLLSARQWRGMFEWLGRPEQFADPKYDHTIVRFKAAKQLYPLIERLFAGLTTDEAIERGQALNVPVAGLASPAAALSTPAFHEAGSFGNVDLPDGPATIPTGPFVIDGERAGFRHPPLEAGPPGTQRDPATAPTGFTRASRPFEGLKVLDLGVIVVGAELGRLFADYGADVVKVESRAFPDGSRGTFDGVAMTDGFAYGHRNKRSLGLNLRSDEGKRVFADLVRTADVILTNFKPGTLAALGFGWDELRRLNPRIVLSESSAFGNEGPWSRRLGYGPLVRASAGLSALWCYPDHENSFSDAITIYPDHVVARLNAAAVAALLLRRARTGHGGRVSTAQVDTIFFAMADLLARESRAPHTIRAEGNNRKTDAPRGVFRARGDDEWLVIDPVGDEQFRALSALVGRHEWIEQYPTADARLATRTDLEKALTEWLAGHDPDDAADMLQRAGVPAARMARVPDLITDPHLGSRDAFRTLHQPHLPKLLPTGGREAVAMRLDHPRTGPAPIAGQHTRAVIGEWLGRNDETIEALFTTGALEERTGDA